MEEKDFICPIQLQGVITRARLGKKRRELKAAVKCALESVYYSISDSRQSNSLFQAWVSLFCLAGLIRD
ncbi:hypothetical protein HAX54_050024 [Datura stramonium]|uniref:Uncharacterized protein n=1 Tax=Datura stramonium TaxID=4076 RepID=A0ABS8WNC6_DATST|nr:hypothetical protein [Datura stramonium]